MESGIRFLLEVFTAYIITCVVTSSSLFGPLRERLKRTTPWLVIACNKHPIHPIECRLCFGFWASLAVCVIDHNLVDTLAVYGASYFLATQER